MGSPLHDVILAQKRGESIGLFSVCSANPVVIETSVKFAAERNIPLLIESTCNQVNQYGGYTGLFPGFPFYHKYGSRFPYDHLNPPPPRIGFTM